MSNSKNVHLFVGTHKGAFILTSDLDRKKWNLNGPFHPGVDVHYMFCDTRNEPTIYASINSEIWGPTVRYSTDMGETWVEAEQDVRFEEGSDRKVKRVWCTIPGGDNYPGVLYAGVDPGAMFKTEDGGKNWSELTDLAITPLAKNGFQAQED